MRALFAIVGLVGCANGGAALSDAPDTVVIDAKQWLDGHIEGPMDSQVPVDTQMIVTPDAPLDAYVCTPTNQQLLANPALDLTPVGTGWTLVNIDNAYPVITGDGSLDEHSAPYKVWMGGFEAADFGVNSVSDSLAQNVLVPAGTTMLRVTGQYAVGTGEIGTTVYDTAQLGLTKLDGTPIETALSLTNATTANAWTPLSFTFTAPNLANTTVRFRIVSSNDSTRASSFYFDTLALTATVCL